MKLRQRRDAEFIRREVIEMLTFCVKLLNKDVDDIALWTRIGRDGINLSKVNTMLWVHGKATEAEFYNILEECLAVSRLSIEVRR